MPPEVRSKYPQVEWADMAGMRDVLIHPYFGIDLDIVWGVLQKEIPDLHHELQHIIATESK